MRIHLIIGFEMSWQRKAGGQYVGLSRATALVVAETITDSATMQTHQQYSSTAIEN